MIGGDQLTVARICGTQALCDTHDKAFDRLEGLTPIVEDWHTRMTFSWSPAMKEDITKV